MRYLADGGCEVLFPDVGSGAKASGRLTCMARALRPKWRLSARCRKVFRSRKSTARTPGLLFHKMQRDVVNISISAIKFLSYSKFILAKRTEQ